MVEKKGSASRGTIRPIILERLLRKARAVSFGLYRSRFIASWMRLALSGETIAAPLRTRDTVMGATPAIRATSVIVALRGALLAFPLLVVQGLAIVSLKSYIEAD